MNTEILTSEYRGSLLDLVHSGYISVVDEMGNIIGKAGSSDEVVFFRSSSKPIQALATIARDLDKKYCLTDEETAIFSASHNAEQFHIDVLESIYKKADLKEADLIMHPTKPASEKANEERIKKGLPLRKMHHVCSGKHAALLMLQRELTGSVKDYEKMDSAVQIEILRVISVLSEYPQDKIAISKDGCGVPVFGVPMKNIALAYKNLALPKNIKDDNLAEAAARYIPRITPYSRMISGTGMVCTELNKDKNIIAKSGATGVYCIGLKNEGVGISVKVKDGSLSPMPLIIKEIFNQIGYREEKTIKALNDLDNGIVMNDSGDVVGERKAVFKLER